MLQKTPKLYRNETAFKFTNRVLNLLCLMEITDFHCIALVFFLFQIFFRRNADRVLSHRCIGANLEDKDKIYVDKARIQNCPRCRLQKCIEVGMSVQSKSHSDLFRVPH